MATLATDLSCSTLIRRELHPLGWIKRFHCLIINSPSSELFPTRRISVPGPTWPPSDTPCPSAAECRAALVCRSVSEYRPFLPLPDDTSCPGVVSPVPQANVPCRMSRHLRTSLRLFPVRPCWRGSRHRHTQVRLSVNLVIQCMEPELGFFLRFCM